MEFEIVFTIALFILILGIAPPFNDNWPFA